MAKKKRRKSADCERFMRLANGRRDSEEFRRSRQFIIDHQESCMGCAAYTMMESGDLTEDHDPEKHGTVA